MKVGDLVKRRCPATTQVGKAFLVTETRINWIKVLAHGESVGWSREDDWELVNEAG